MSVLKYERTGNGFEVEGELQFSPEKGVMIENVPFSDLVKKRFDGREPIVRIRVEELETDK